MKYTLTTLKNGLRIVTVPMKANQTATVMVLVSTGSDYEDKKNNGISHFLEHMCFKGTEKRSMFDITEELDALGAQSNAFTSNEFTGYYAKAHYKQVPKMIDIVSDVYLNSVFPDAEIKKESGVIVEEINMYKDLPRRQTEEVLFDLMYRDQPAGQTTLGPKKNILGMRRDDFVDYHKKHYVSEGTVVVVSGNIDEKKVLEQIGEAFKNIRVAKKPGKVKTKDIQAKPQVKLLKKKTDQTHFVLGFRAYSMGDKRDHAVELLATVLGRGMSSRLFKKMREELGVCYYVGAGYDTFIDHGVFYVSAGVANKRFEEAVEAIIAELRLIKDEKVSEKELEKAKQFMMGNLALSLESSDSFGNWYGFRALVKKGMDTPEEYTNKLKAVTADDIQKVARDLFEGNKANLAIVGDVPIQKIKKYLTMK